MWTASLTLPSDSPLIWLRVVPYQLFADPVGAFGNGGGESYTPIRTCIGNVVDHLSRAF